MTAILILIGGLLYRQRGGGIDLPIGTQGARLIWCIPTGALVAWLLGDWHVGVVVAILAFAGLMIPHGAYQDDGTCGGTPVSDAIGMSAVNCVRGCLIALPIAISTFGTPYGWSLPAMAYLPAFSGPMYWFAWQIPSKIPHLEQGAALGEFFTGCLFWAGILLAIGV